MINATQHRKVATRFISFAAVGLLLEGNLSLYQLEEILICWLVFSLAFVSLAILILAVIFVFCALGEHGPHDSYRQLRLVLPKFGRE
jgi:hypothetical protein